MDVGCLTSDTKKGAAFGPPLFFLWLFANLGEELPVGALLAKRRSQITAGVDSTLRLASKAPTKKRPPFGGRFFKTYLEQIGT
ncbi:hypothetical protein A3713_02865 [Alcanivorax sp. HI0003]|nr:hypothetical protein A3713_02865 [Alcanivorax sp. HI0003]